MVVDYYVISIDGVPREDYIEALTEELALYKANFRVFERSSFIYGLTDRDTFKTLVSIAGDLGYPIDSKWGC